MKFRVIVASVFVAGALVGCAPMSTGDTSAPPRETPAATSELSPTPASTPTEGVSDGDPAATEDALKAAAQAHIDALFAGDADEAIGYVSDECTQQAALYPGTAEVLHDLFPDGTPRAEVVVTGMAGDDGTVNVTYPDGITEDQTWVFESGAWRYTGKVGAFCT